MAAAHGIPEGVPGGGPAQVNSMDELAAALGEKKADLLKLSAK